MGSGILDKWRLRTRTQSGRAETFRQFILFAGAVGFTLAFGFSGMFKLGPLDAVALIQSGIAGQLSAITYVKFLVYVVLFLFGLSWGFNGLYELNLLQEWLKAEHFTIKRRNLVHATSVLVGVLLGILFALTPQFSTFVYVFIFYTFVDLFLWRLRRDEIADLIENSVATLDRDFKTLPNAIKEGSREQDIWRIFRAGANLLREYYLVRSHYGRVGIQLAFVIAIAVCPLLWLLKYHGEMPKDFTLDGIKIVGYLLLVWGLSISEVTVYIWRRDLDTRLAALARRLSELEAT